MAGAGAAVKLFRAQVLMWEVQCVVACIVLVLYMTLDDWDICQAQARQTEKKGGERLPLRRGLPRPRPSPRPRRAAAAARKHGSPALTALALHLQVGPCDPVKAGVGVAGRQDQARRLLLHVGATAGAAGGAARAGGGLAERGAGGDSASGAAGARGAPRQLRAAQRPRAAHLAPPSPVMAQLPVFSALQL